MPIDSAARWMEETLPGRLQGNPDRARAIGGIFELVLDGEGGGTWTLDLTVPRLRQGGAGRMNCRIRLSAADFLSLLQGRLDATDAFRAGRLKVEGNLALSMKIQALTSPEGW